MYTDFHVINSNPINHTQTRRHLVKNRKLAKIIIIMLIVPFITGGCIVLKSKYDELEVQYNEALDDISGLEDDVDGLESDKSDLETTVADLEGSVATHLETISGLQSNIADLDANVADLDSQVADLETLNSELQALVDDLQDLADAVASTICELTFDQYMNDYALFDFFEAGFSAYLSLFFGTEVYFTQFTPPGSEYDGDRELETHNIAVSLDSLEGAFLIDMTANCIAYNPDWIDIDP